VLEETVHPEQGGNVKILFESGSNLNGTTVGMERNVMEPCLFRASDSSQEFAFPGFQIESNCSCKVGMKEASASARIDHRLNSLCARRIRHREGNLDGQNSRIQMSSPAIGEDPK
jgi:hypothetical protein